MRRYELRFVTIGGRVLRGPIFGKKEHTKYCEAIHNMDDFTVFRMSLGRNRIVIPEKMLEHGYFQIKPVGPLYTLIRVWRSR